MSNRHGFTTHHVKPRSRGGQNGKIIEVPDSFHVHWHALFENLYDRECIQFMMMICKAMEQGNIIRPEDLARWRHMAMGANDAPPR